MMSISWDNLKDKGKIDLGDKWVVGDDVDEETRRR
jgi:hypothetical protein